MAEDPERFAEDDPRHHTIKIRQMLSDIRDHLREDISNSPYAKAPATISCQRLESCGFGFSTASRASIER